MLVDCLVFAEGSEFSAFRDTIKKVSQVFLYINLCVYVIHIPMFIHYVQ